ncbi:eukaryotic translation initiation factor [Niveomyces insectorum RCEF 264]|uniref:Eukaryotic translation initiation factor n=1 Tax=Niveomyces insectorum RCEF 264 TaxID=1081102 RepID=A0A167MMK4_9HYPO|nr:eukaryotic translation initiation factor [Niveomyces insectorum RCEF 264]
MSEEAAAQQGAEWAGTNGGEMAVGEEQNQPSSDMQVSEKHAQDPDVLAATTAAASAASVAYDPSGDSSSQSVDFVGGAAEYDPLAAPAVNQAAASDDGGEEAGEDEEQEGGSGNDDEGDGNGNGEEGQGPGATVTEPVAQVPPPKKPKAVGGFLVGDSDSEDDGDDNGGEHTFTEPTDPSDLQEPEYDPAQISTDPPSAYGGQQQQQQQQPPPAPSSSAKAIAVSGAETVASHQPAHAVAGGVPGDGQLPALTQQSHDVPLPFVAPDAVAALEARIADDPRGAVDSWLALINEHRRNNRLDEARSVYKRFFDVFPQAAEVWVQNIEMELEINNFLGAEELFGKSLTKVLNVPLWTVYLNYVRRRNDVQGGSEARNVVTRAYEFVLDNVGQDKESGQIWYDYVQFVRSGPGTIGGSGWQDQQKMDQLRKAYRRATSVPISNVNQLWKEYDQFEMGLNKITGRKFLAERSPAYMSAKSANTALENVVTRGLHRTTIPRLPPVAGFEGYQEYMTQVDLWQKWIAWEKSDPLDLRVDEPAVYRARILYCYQQALMPLRFWPELWVEAAAWCFDNDVREAGKEKGLDLLLDGIAANPESILLAFTHADRIEATHPVGEGDEAKIARGQAVRVPYDRIIQTLRDLHKSLQDREKAEVSRVEEAYAKTAGRRSGHENDGGEDDGNGSTGDGNGDDDDDDDDDEGQKKKTNTAADEEKQQKITLIKKGFTAQMDLVSKCLTHVWIALARAMRRIQGKGNPQGPLGGLRQVFYEARKGGRLKSDIYVAVANMEWKCYNDKAGGKILERGAKLFPEDPYFMIEYIKYLIAHGDNTNSRVVFETCVNRLAQNPETVHKAKPLLAFMHKREAAYGDRARIVELEKRMGELFPDDPKLALFSKRFATDKFDPVGARIIVSPATQLRPRLLMPSIEQQQQQQAGLVGSGSLRNSPAPSGGAGVPAIRRQPPTPNSPRMHLLGTGGTGAIQSPKRPFPVDDYNHYDGNDGNPPRKLLRAGAGAGAAGGADAPREFQRGESPLKGAAGRRLDQQRRLHGLGGGTGHNYYGGGGGGAGSGSAALPSGAAMAPPPPLPTMVNFLLGQIPPASQYNGVRYKPAGVVQLLRETEIDPNAWEARNRGGGSGGGSRHAPYGRHSRHVSGSDYGAPTPPPQFARAGRPLPATCAAAGLARLVRTAAAAAAGSCREHSARICTDPVRLGCCSGGGGGRWFWRGSAWVRPAAGPTSSFIFVFIDFVGTSLGEATSQIPGGPPGGPPHQRRPSHGSAPGGSQAGGYGQQRRPSFTGSQGGPPPQGSELPLRQRPASPGPASGKPSNPYGPGLGYDPARSQEEEAKRKAKEMPNRIDLPPEAYSLETPFTRRPGYNEKDKPVALRVNQYRVEQTSNVKVYQYAVGLVPEPSRPIVYKKCWASKKVQDYLNRQKKIWLYDGRSLAWSICNIKDPFLIKIDLDAENGKTPREGMPRNEFTMQIKQTSTIYLEALVAYLRGTNAWDTHILECMNFFDHALRQKPSLYMTAIRRNFYHPDAPKRDLDKTVYAAKGIYAAFRLSESIRSGGSGLGINVDVANTTFWKDQRLDQLVLNFLQIASDKWCPRNHQEAMELLRPVQWSGNTKLNEPTVSEAFKCLRKLQKLRFTVNHIGKTNDQKIYTIKNFAWHQKYMFEGAHTKNYTFTVRKTNETRTVFDHYKKQYNITLQNFKYPVVETTRDGAFPMEVCHVLPWQRYNFKLNSAQTADMIKFAVTRPAERGKNITENVNRLGWNTDENLREFGIRVNPNMAQVQGRLLQPPSVAYKNTAVKPGTSGRWDLRQKTFLINNKGRELQSWGVAVVDSCVDQPAVQNFVRVFMKTYKDHGGLVVKPPCVTAYPRGMPQDDVYLKAYNATVAANNGDHPVLMFFVLPNKNQFTYYRLKKSGDCRFGMVSQMVNAQHVLKAQPQYCSNVAMKVNAKLGGTNCRVPAEGANAAAPAFFKAPTMIIGVDVSHGSVNMKNELEPSMAAMSVSWDKDAAKYAAFCQTNGYRVEIINPIKMESMFNGALQKWCQTLNCRMPAHVFYLRDGVSEGQFAQVMEIEVGELKKIFLRRCGKVPQFTVIVATKRHHIRFFPDNNSGDRNGNPLPGTVVEKEVTHPFHYDFYLCSHVALQGTARPVHYHVIHDEIKMPPHLLQKMLYQQCYQYARSTTPVSLHPAVYYAHLAGDRARSHETIGSEKKDPVLIKQQMTNWTAKKPSSNRTTHPTEAPPLLPFGAAEAVDKNKSFTPFTMWYI